MLRHPQQKNVQRRKEVNNILVDNNNKQEEQQLAVSESGLPKKTQKRTSRNLKNQT
jgi:hypothetical protein